MWSDESTFSLFQDDGHTRVRRVPDEAMDSSCIVPTVQANGGSIMVWGRFNGPALGSPTLCDSKMKLLDYLNVFNDQVIPLMDFFLPESICIFQDDNARIHQAQIIENWFREHEDSFSPLNRPPQNPDLNRIENFWTIREQRLRGESSLLSSIQCLSEKLLQIWMTISAGTIQNLIQTMQHRIRALI